jgi:hypothetical protein
MWEWLSLPAVFFLFFLYTLDATPAKIALAYFADEEAA